MVKSLSAIAEHGSAILYQGALGASLCKASAARGGALQTDDLRAYEPLWCEPLSLGYRGYTVQVAPPNSFGLLMLLQLGALAGLSMGDIPLASTERLRCLMTATRLAVETGAPFLCDPGLARDPNPLLAPDSLGRLQAAVHEGRRQSRELPRSNGTAVISVVDAQGNGVTIVQSVFTPFGSMVADKETGIVLNNRLLGFSVDPNDPNVAAPAKRPAHTLSPAMVLKDGKPAMLLGTPGGTGQTITLTQVLTNVVDHNLPLPQAIELPRWAMDVAGNFVVEPEIADAVVDELNARGIAVKKATAAQRFFFGSAECIRITDAGLQAVADDRRDATAAAI
jgi:gamma-glutamyltranspeptidase/glutathione hydrolase